MRSTFLTTGLAALLLSSTTTVNASPIDLDVDLPESELQTLSLSRTTIFGNTVGSLCGCTLLSLVSFGKVYYPGSQTYLKESTNYWSKAVWAQPSCVFVPKSAGDVARGVAIARVCQTDFGIRGGGHMPVPGYASVKNGVLFSSTGLDTLALSTDKKTLHLGPSHRWMDVYAFLKPHNLYAIGGRVGIVGVPGLIIGGGVNFFTNKYGFAMDNVVSFEVVLASSKIVTATATNKYKDLFWALKGGTSNFGMVTKFEIEVYPLEQVWTGITQFVGTEENLGQFFSAIEGIAKANYTVKGAGVIPQIAYTPGVGGAAGSVTGITVLMHEGEEVEPTIFDQFTQIPVIPGSGNYTLTHPLDTSLALSAGLPEGNNHVFRIHSSTADQRAVKFVWDTIYANIPALEAAVPSLMTNGVAIQPIPTSALQVGKTKYGGNAFGIKDDESYVWYCLSASWTEPAQAEEAYKWIEGVGKQISEGLKAQGLVGNGGKEFLYLNDAQGGQEVFEGYGEVERNRLREVRDKYDPQGKVFGKNGLSKGGFKL